MLQDLFQRMLEDLETINFTEEFVLGSFAGFAICIVGHPFDTVKTRMQNSHKSLVSVMTSTIRQEGVLAFYKGITSPLASTPLINAVVFSTYEVSKVIIRNNTDLDKMNAMAMAGAVAGFFNAFIAGPVELFKIKLQVQTTERYYKSYGDIAAKLYKVSGVTGWFQGTYATMLRDTISIGAQFWSYEYVLRSLKAKYHLGEDKEVAWPYLIAGSVAGISCWVSSYPIDVAKSRLQAQVLGEKVTSRFNGSMVRELRSIYAHHGFNGLFSGIVPIMGRAALANAVGFWAWEKSKKLLRGKIN